MHGIRDAYSTLLQRWYMNSTKQKTMMGYDKSVPVVVLFAAVAGD